MLSLLPYWFLAWPISTILDWCIHLHSFFELIILRDCKWGWRWGADLKPSNQRSNMHACICIWDETCILHPVSNWLLAVIMSYALYQTDSAAITSYTLYQTDFQLWLRLIPCIKLTFSYDDVFYPVWKLHSAMIMSIPCIKMAFIYDYVLCPVSNWL